MVDRPDPLTLRLAELHGDDATGHDPDLDRRLREAEEHPEGLIDGEQFFREERERLRKRRQP